MQIQAKAKKSGKKKVFEKKTKETYPSKAAKAKHEKAEPKSERIKEYGKKAVLKKKK